MLLRKILLVTLICISLFSLDGLYLSTKQADYISKKVWSNEGSGRDKYLIWWNKGEDFASLGIGHFIWFPKGHTEKFREVFPMYISFLQKKGVQMPDWLNAQTDLPWDSREALFRAKKYKSRKYKDLFRFLKKTKPYQAEFMSERMILSLAKIIAKISDPLKAKKIKNYFTHLLYHKDGSIDERGLYVLIDYINFKGEGTLETERYNGFGWGLLQVLDLYDINTSNKYKAFADSAKKVLNRRIYNSPIQRNEKQWRKGWFKRVDTYWK